MAFKQVLISLDEKAFYFINQRLKNRFFDRVMPVITTERYFRVALLAVVIILLIAGTPAVRIEMLLVALVVGLADQTCNFLKRTSGRLRPGLTLPNVNQMVKAGRLSFPSAHAANNLGTAIVVSWFAPQLGAWFLGLALIIGFSRVYCGVHYPLDVLIGFRIGGLYALGVCMGYIHFFS